MKIALMDMYAVKEYVKELPAPPVHVLKVRYVLMENVFLILAKDPVHFQGISPVLSHFLLLCARGVRNIVRN